MDSLNIVADTSDSSGVADHALARPLSAIATLSNIISPVHSTSISTGPSSAASLAICTISKPMSPFLGPGSLPTETLLSIFQLVFETCIDWDRTGIFHPKHRTVWLEDDPLSPSLFPYSLASVCARWFHILSSVPVYWTRQVITVDSHETSLIATQTMLQFAEDLPLQLIVTRHPSISEGVDRDERTRVRVALDIIQPHIHHAWSLNFNVVYSSSLPALWTEKGDAQYLKMLPLMGSHCDTSSLGCFPRSPEPHTGRNGNGRNTSAQAHSLQEVMLGGHLFNDALAFGERNLWFRNVTFLTIRGYTTSGGSRISLHEFITTVQTCGLLQRLTVEDVAFVNDVHSLHRFRLEAPVVSLRNITDEDAVRSIMSQTLGIRLKEVVTISDCPFDGLGKRSSFRTRISSVNLILEGMNASIAAMRQLICFWNGERLSLTSCPGVSASFLQGVPTEETPPNLRRLRILDCENASAEGLITLVKSREIQSAIDTLIPRDPDDEPCVALVELGVHGRGPPISTEQAAWFAEHVENFAWDTIASDGMKYTWDTSARELIVVPTHD